MSDTMIWADGHAIFTCGPNSGHSVKVIAFCASASEAANIAALMLVQRGEAVRMPESVDEARTMAGVAYLYLREHDPKFRRAVDDIVAERDRQIVHEKFDAFHDDHHGNGELAQAAACYAENSVDVNGPNNSVPAMWPWHDSWWKPGDRRRDLVKAGALIVAEIERLDRADAGKRYKVDSPFEPEPGEHQEVLDAIRACDTGEDDG